MSDWEWIDGYQNDIEYTDNLIFNFDSETKKIAKIYNQPIVSGENLSQFIRFEFPRYYDGIDLSTKNIQFIYIAENGYTDINAARCVERNDEHIRFGWLVPGEACSTAGTLSFGVEFVGNDYTMKSMAVDVTVYDGLNGGDIIPEPEEKVWYIELQSRCDYVLSTAETARDEANISKQAAESAKNDAQSAATSAKASEDAVKTSADNAKASADDAKASAELAASTFKIAGDISFAVADDGSVKMIFTD